MNICVCGWHFLPSFYKELKDCGRPAMVVAHRTSGDVVPQSIPIRPRLNIGLEFGAYNHYLMNEWPEDCSVVFIHDDIEFDKPFSWILDNIEGYAQEHDIDHFWIFGCEEEAIWNQGEHGRMFWMSERLLDWWKHQGGFFFDRFNGGDTKCEPDQKRMHYNAGVRINSFIMRGVNLNTNHVVYVQGLKPMYRGSRDRPWEEKNGT